MGKKGGKSGGGGGYSSSPYQPAANLLNEIWGAGRGGGGGPTAGGNKKNTNITAKSLKAAAYDAKSGELKVSKSTYAIACRVLEHRRVLQSVLEALPENIIGGGASSSSFARNEGLLYVLLHELLMGPNKTIRGGGALKRKLMRHEKDLRKALARIRAKGDGGGGGGGSDATKSARDAFPRYVRVNAPLRASGMAEVAEILKERLGIETLFRDRHVPDLLVLPPGSTGAIVEKCGADLLKTGKVVLQDKSSCLPALCLVRGFNGGDDGDGAEEDLVGVAPDFLDACAAPGNKTTHLASLLADQKQQQQRQSSTATGKKSKKGKDKQKKKEKTEHGVATTIYAFDRSMERLELLRRRVGQLVPQQQPSDDDEGAYSVKVSAQLEDFLSAKPEDYPRVGSILLDPSCSGSGIYTSVDRAAADDEGGGGGGGGGDGSEDQRLASLSGFQCRALVHAMSFPRAKRIVYSTCSVNVEENERVVARALKYFREHTEDGDDEDRSWQVVPPKCLDTWERRGVEVAGSDGDGDSDDSDACITAEQASCMIRADRDDETNGFFVCCLQRRKKQPGGSGKQGKSQQGKESASTTTSRSDRVSGHSKEDGIPFYDGQFAQTYATDATNGTRTHIIGDEGATIAASDKKTATSSGGSKDRKRKTTSHGRSSEDGGKEGEINDIAPISKKRRKKLEWKKRQRQAKLERQAQQEQGKHKTKKE